jgi:hypothetical protein
MADLEVTSADLNNHAAQVEALMSAVRGAAAYGDQAFDVRAFGLIGSSWSWILQAWTQDAKNLVDTTADTGNALAAAMREMATAYDQHDAASARTFSQIQDTMGPAVTTGG